MALRQRAAPCPPLQTGARGPVALGRARGSRTRLCQLQAPPLEDPRPMSLRSGGPAPRLLTLSCPPQYGIKKKEEREAEAQAAMEANSEGSLTRPKKAIPPGCGDEPEEEDESILDTVIKYLPGPLQDMFKK